jgi:hypothetical protein
MKRLVEGEDRSQSTLLPERLDDYIAEDNPVRVIDVFRRSRPKTLLVGKQCGVLAWAIKIARSSALAPLFRPLARRGMS